MYMPSSILTLLLTSFVGFSLGYIDQLSNKCSDLHPGIVGWAGYIEKWRSHDLLKSERMYPYGPDYCDVSDRNGESVKINDQVLFYAVQYDSIILTVHGHISFSTPDRPPPPTNGEWTKPQPWPNQYYGMQDAKDPALAAIFYTTQAIKKSGALNFRTLRRTGQRDAVSHIQDGMLDYLSIDIQEAVVGASKFVATYGLVVTWENMTFIGANCNADYVNDNCPRNTYQMALVTDEKDTFVVYNYYNISWAGTTSMGCDPKTGRVSDSSPDCVGAQIGFNVGDGRYFWTFPYSLSMRVLELDEEHLRGSTVRGRYFFKVSDAFIQRGGCTNDDSMSGDKWPLTIGPTAGGMFGGYDMNISAPCFVGGERIQCKFGQSQTTEGFFEQNAMMARCPVPLMKSVGRVKVGVSNDGGSNFRFSTHLTVGMPGYVPTGVTIDNPSNDWLNVEKFDIGWDPYGISWRTVDYVDIRLYGYKESDVTEDTTRVLLHTLVTDWKNDGYYTIHADQYQCGGLDAEINCVEYTVGLLAVVVSGTNPGASPTALWSEPLPMGWYIKSAAPSILGNNWAHELCKRWHSSDLKNQQWNKDLQVCPCTLSQAFHDWGRFADDLECNNRATGTNYVKCNRHKGAVHCVKATVPTSTGAGAQCCYDKSGDLLYSGDTQYGSTPDKAHSWGTPPYGVSGRVPLLSHWYWDLAPFYACCEWQEGGPDCFNYYIKQRPTPSCQHYKLSGRAAAFGDPHIKTFDGVTYTYNGKGEYILILAENVMVDDKRISFTLQARYQQPQAQNWGVPRGSVITAVAMRTSVIGVKDGQLLEIQRNNYKPGDRKLLVYVDGILIDFRDPAMWRQDFQDFIIFNNDPVSAKHHSNFTVISRDSLVGVQVAYTAGFIQVVTVVPPELKEHTLGLFGKWDGFPSNDILSRDGGNPVPPDETERIHEVVGSSWQVSEAESLFTYWAKVNKDYYEDRDFRPEFTPKFPPNNTGVTPDQVDRVCHNDLACEFDYMITLDPAVAQSTLDVQSWLQHQTEETKEVITCGLLDIPNALKSGGKPYPGATVTITGCRHDYTLEGPTQYECDQDGSVAYWTPAISTRCLDPATTKKAETRMAIAIGVPVGLVFVIIVIGVVGLLCYLRQKRIDRGPKAPPGDDLEHVPVSQFHASDIRDEDYLTNDQRNTSKKKPRPAKRSDMSASRSQDDLSMYGSQRRNNNDVPSRVLSSSVDALDRDVSGSTKGSSLLDEIDLNQSLQSDNSRRPRPYNYPRNTETLGERRRAPYAYPRNTETNLTPEQRALIEERTRAYNNPEL